MSTRKPLIPGELLAYQTAAFLAAAGIPHDRKADYKGREWKLFTAGFELAARLADRLPVVQPDTQQHRTGYGEGVRAAAKRAETVSPTLAEAIRNLQSTGPVAASPAPVAAITDLSHRLRETADQQPGWKPLLTDAADEIERYYGGMLNWKANAQAKDRTIAELRVALAAVPAAAPIVHPVGDYVLMPRRLTAENGAKGALSGEFKESTTVTCHECGGSGEDDEGVDDANCPECHGNGTVEQGVPVTWDTIKRIYKAAVELLAAPASSTAEAKDSARWRETVKHIGGSWTDVGAQRFTLRYLSPVEGANIMQGSVAEHFTAAIDAARAAGAKGGV